MNIFKALSQGDGSINETNVTSFLSYVIHESNEFLNEPVKPILRTINTQYELGIDLERKPGRSKNTQVLGKEVLQALLDKQSKS